MQYSFLHKKSCTPNSTFNPEDMEASTNHTKLTIGTKTKQLKKIETYCQQQHQMLEIQNSINSNNL